MTYVVIHAVVHGKYTTNNVLGMFSTREEAIRCSDQRVSEGFIVIEEWND